MSNRKINFDKIQDSLEQIKIVCEEHQEGPGCMGCPLGTKYGTCALSQFPKNWTIRHPEVDVFRVVE